MCLCIMHSVVCTIIKITVYSGYEANAILLVLNSTFSVQDLLLSLNKACTWSENLRVRFM